MTATTADYTWFGDGFPELAQAYCLTLVPDTSGAPTSAGTTSRERPS